MTLRLLITNQLAVNHFDQSSFLFNSQIKWLSSIHPFLPRPPGSVAWLRFHLSSRHLVCVGKALSNYLCPHFEVSLNQFTLNLHPLN